MERQGDGCDGACLSQALALSLQSQVQDSPAGPGHAVIQVAGILALSRESQAAQQDRRVMSRVKAWAASLRDSAVVR
jgi:hypothetical protein